MTAPSLMLLARHDPGPRGQVISLYLDQSGRDRPRQSDLTHAIDALLRAARRLAEEATERDQPAARAAIGQAAAVLTAERDRSRARGLAIFADQDSVIGCVAAPQPFGDAVSLGLVADLRQLVARRNRAARFLVALIDHARARLFDVVEGELVEEHDIADPRPRAVDRERGGRAGGFQAAIDAVADRHADHVGAAISHLLERRGDQRLVLGGVADAVAALADRLAPPARRALIEDRLHVPVAAGPEEVLSALEPVAERLEQVRLQGVLDEAHAAVGQGRAGLGLGAALRTLDDRRTDLVVVGDGYRHPGLVCRTCGALFAHESTCTSCGDRTEPVSDIVGHVIVTALRQQARVEIVPADAVPWPDPVATIARF
jgi:hypothetical protein